MMNLKNTREGYGLVARIFHGVLAVFLIYQLYLGFWMVDLPDDMKRSIYADHKMYGLIIMYLVVLRLLWRLMNMLPDLPLGTPTWQIWAARALHRLFYFLMIIMPVTGWMMSTAAGYLPSLPMFGKVGFPFFSGETFCIVGFCTNSEWVGNITHDVHAIIGLLFACLLCAHIGIAIWHAHLKDGVFSRIFLDRT